jgi:hypothetical protein
MFALPATPGRTIDQFLSQSGRVEAIWFPFTANPWLKVWTKTPTKPSSSREVDQPFNYTFSDNLPPKLTELIAEIQMGSPQLAPALGRLQWAVAATGLEATVAWDLWGWSKNTSLYVRPTTLRVTANGYAIVCRRADVQRVIHEFTQLYQSKVGAYRALRRYPMNGPVEIRVTGLDQPGDVGVAGAQPVQLSATRPRPDHPEWDCAVWLDILTVPGTPYAKRVLSGGRAVALGQLLGDLCVIARRVVKGLGVQRRGRVGLCPCAWQQDPGLVERRAAGRPAPADTRLR